MASEPAEEIVRTYRGSDGDRTKALYQRLEALGPAGLVAVQLLRAQKNSERAKTYRSRRSRFAAYDTKEWAMDKLREALMAHAAALGIVWGWGEDEGQPFHKHVLYVELPTGQVSFHAAVRGGGPDYEKRWDGVRGVSADRIIRWAARLLSSTERAVA